MIYLDNGATSFHKPASVFAAVTSAMHRCANPGRGGYAASVNAAQVVFSCRERIGEFFGCDPENVVLTSNCTHSLNIAINTLVKPGSTVVVSGFEHNAVIRPLYARQAEIVVAGKKLFDWDDTLNSFETALRSGADAAVFTHVSNVFGYILPVEQMAALCRQYGVPFIIDAAQSAGYLHVDFAQLGADFIAMPGHKGLLGPQGTGVLLCASVPQPLLYGGTGSASIQRTMPEDLPERAEAGTLNVPGIAGLKEGISCLQHMGVDRIYRNTHRQMTRCAAGLEKMGLTTFSGDHQLATVSFLPQGDTEEFAQQLAQRGIAVRAGLHCAPLAHESAGTLHTGTVRVSFGHTSTPQQTDHFLRSVANIVN